MTDSLRKGIVTIPNQALAELPPLTDAEKHQLFVEWNDTRIDYPGDKCIHELFEAQVARTPDAVAVMFEEQQVTYGDLNGRANQVAHYLRKLGVGPESLVGLCLERSVEMVVGILAILKVGGAYVPLEPTYPRARLEFMLADTGAGIVLTDNQSLNCLPQTGAQVICLDRDRQLFEREPTENPASSTLDEHAAYVIYTSGSTGTPKGVINIHAGLRNRLQWMQETYRLTAQDRVLQKTPFTFDVSVWEFLWPLISGACLVVARPEGHRDREYLIRLIQSARVTTLHFVPSMLSVFLQGAGPESCTTLKQVFCSGESLSVELQRRFFERSHASLYNLYGPTEVSIDVTAWECRRAGNDPIVPIGRPISNTQIYILDQSLAPLPVGVAGDLYIGGVGLARGYLNRPELTSERFVANPFSEDPSARLYKTGDRARYLTSGDIEFLGRIDDQVKIRGFRIELGEIEAVLAQHRSIKESVVIARDDSFGSQRLVAYVVVADAASVPSINELRGFLEKTLPEYMVPSAFEFLESLPLTPNGKLDRGALPAPARSRPKLEENYSPPQTPVEELLAHIWADVLTLDQVGIHDNFFALGGNSLRAIQMIARLRNVLNKELFVSEIFYNGTIAKLANLLTQRTDKAIAFTAQPSQRIERHRRLPLSFSQERIWFIQQLYPLNRAYQFQSLFYFTGYLNVDALECSLGEIVRRHEIFRTTFPEIEGEPIQDIHPPFSVSLPILNLQDMPGHERQAVLQKQIAEEAGKPFDLNTLPLIRWTLVQLKADEFVLIHVEHHLVHDGWSFNLFRRELLEIYKAFAAGEASPLPDPTLQFSDFASWQRRWMEGEPAKRQLAYWQRQLRGSPSALALATDHARPPLPSFRGAAPRYAISRALADSLRALSRERGTTLFMTMFAVFVALLYRYTQQEDILVGTAVGNRRWKESEGLIGMLVNNAVLRTCLADNPRFIDLLDQVKGVALEAYANEDIPFDQVVRALNLKRDDSRNPIFQIMFSFHDAPLMEPSLPGINFKCVEVISNQSAKFDLNVIVIPRREQNPADCSDADSITMIWEHSSDLFEPDTIERMAGHYLRLLEEIIADPSKRISDLAILTEAEKHQLLVEWNATKRDYPKDTCVHQLFEEQVEQTPGAVAVVFEDQQLTYRELNSRVNQLAHYLKQLGVGPEVLVGICMERSLELIVALLGVLKAGGAYVPLDPSYPKERLDYMIKDAQVRVLLTQEKFLSSVGYPSVVCLDSEWDTIASQSTDDPKSSTTSANLAYVIYTSGSTGQPKGVAIEHRNAVAFLSWAHSVFNREYLSGVLASTSICFDLSVFEIFAPLTCGGSVVLVENALALATISEPSKVSFLNTVPSAIRELLRLKAIPPSVHFMNLAGEALGSDLVQRIYESTAVRKLYDLYGPTECTTYSTYGCRTLDVPQTIGRPITNTQIYILDPQLNPVPIGVIGEIHIGGDGLARGYINRPEATKEKFIANPFSRNPDSRLYTTGDLGRYLPNGNIEFHGRIDNQVKVRGYRIELGEIEAVLGQHPMIQSSVVVVQEDTPGDKRLVAYLVGRQGKSFDAAEIRKYLKEKLPEYMIPSVFMRLDELPWTPNGKVDRRALPAPDHSRPELDNAFVAPRNAVEAILSNIWAEVLKLETVSVRDNFFELGGHSLLATQVISRMRHAFSIDVPLHRIFEAPTIGEMATVIMGNRLECASAPGQARGPGEIDVIIDEEGE